MSDRVSTTCDQCGQNDDHPKVHYATSTWHHDCTPAKVKQEVINGHPDPELAAAVFSAAESGLKGNDLLQKINELHAEPAPKVEELTSGETDG